MSSVNKVILVGNLGRDPEVRYTQDGGAVASVSLATTYKRDGSEDQTEWHRVVFFKRLAEIAGEYLKKGSQVYVEGFLRTRKWQNKDGQDVYTTEVVAMNLQMLGNRPSGGREDGERHERPSNDKPKTSQRAPVKKSGGSAFDDLDDDIPF